MFASVLMTAALAVGAVDNCNMQPPELQTEKLRQSADVIAATIDQQHSRSSVLLKDGRVVRVAAMGCEHSGMSASLWVFQDASPESAAHWHQLAAELSRLVFPHDVHALLTRALLEARFVVENTDAGLIARLSTPEDLSIDIEVTHLTLGTLVTVSYTNL